MCRLGCRFSENGERIIQGMETTISKARVLKVGAEAIRNGQPSFEQFEFDAKGIEGVIGVDYTHNPPLMCGYSPDELRQMIREREGK